MDKIPSERKGNSGPDNIPLTTREQEILCYLALHPNKTNEDIGTALHISTMTVQTHIRNIKQKLKMNRAGELIKYAVEKNLCS